MIFSARFWIRSMSSDKKILNGRKADHVQVSRLNDSPFT
jgi:hypothetical protein